MCVHVTIATSSAAALLTMTLFLQPAQHGKRATIVLTSEAVFRRETLDLVLRAIVKNVDGEMRIVQGKDVVPGVGQQSQGLIAHRQ